MKALILAAGMGTRLGRYTKELPKGMLNFNGKSLIEWQIYQLRKAGYLDINIVTGYKKEKINFSGIKYFHNAKYDSTNMVESMNCAREILNSDVLVCYSDIIYTQGILELINNFNGDIGVAVDKSWKEYWIQRYNTTETDLESLTVKNGEIIDLGKPVDSSNGIDYRYIGMIKFSENGIKNALEVYNRKKIKNESWIQSGKSFENGYMTDLLNEIILNGNKVEPIISNKGWLEFDTLEDYEVMLKLFNEGKISKDFFN